jgi:ankyrin repeat protein
LVILLAAAGWYGISYVLHVRQEQRDSALLAAVRRHDARSVARLLKDGADPNAQRRRVIWMEIPAKYAPPESFWTRLAKLLHLPSSKQRIEWIDDAPLHIAAVSWDAATARVLLDHGARVNIRDVNGNTPLNRALRAAVAIAHTQGDTPALHASLRSCVALLLERGADPNATACDMATPLALAKRLPDSKVVRMLLRSGATGKTPARPCGP